MSRTIDFIALDELKPDPRNPKAHALETIDSSVGRFGFVEPIVVDSRTGRIVSGHGRAKTLTVMRDRGDTPPEGVTVDDAGRWLVPVVTGWASRTDADAAGALIGLNRTGELGGWVDEDLLGLLEELGAEGPAGLIGVGYGQNDIDNLRIQLDPSLNEPEDTDADDDGRDAARGALLDIADLSMGEPEHQVHGGEHWRAGHHHLFVVNPHTQWEQFLPALQPGTVLAPYPDVWLTLTETAREHPFVLVQPNPLLAGHLLDKHHAAFPGEEISKIIKAVLP